MPKAKPSPTPRKRRPLWLRILFWVLGVVVVLALILAGTIAVFLSSPKAQTWATGKFLHYAIERTGFVGSCDYLFVDYKTRTATVRNLCVTDLQKRPMIRLPQAVIHFQWDSVLRRSVTFDSLEATHAWVNVVTNEKLRSTNFTEFVDTVQAWVNGPKTHSAQDTVKREEPPTFRIHKLKLINCETIISNISRDTIPTGVDYNHLDLVDVDGTVHEFRARADTLEFQTCDLSTHDRRSGFPIKRLCASFRFSRHNMILDRVLLLAGTNTELRNRLGFYYTNPKNLSEFNDSVFVKAHLTDSRIDMGDLARFAPPAKKYHDVVHLKDLEIIGRVVDYTVKHVSLNLGKATHLHGHFRMKGLPKAKPLYLDLTLTGSHLIPQDIKQYLPDSATYEYVKRMGVNDLNGYFKGTPKDFIIKADALGDAGKLHVDLAMQIKKKEDTMYKGRFEADRFQLGHFAGTKLLGDFTGRGYVDGQGLVLAKALIHFKTRIDRVKILGVNIHHVSLRGTLGNHKIANLIGSLRVWKSGPLYKRGYMKPGSNFGLVWEKSKG